MTDVVKPGAESVASGAWIGGIASTHFKTLVVAKRRSILPMIIIYVVGYLGLSVLAGFGRGILGIKVLGAVNVGFVLIAGNYVMSWMLAVAYAWIARNRHDPLVTLVIDDARAIAGRP